MKANIVAALLVLSAFASPALAQAQAPKLAPKLAPALAPAYGPAVAPGPVGALSGLTYAAAPNGCQTVLALLESNPNYSTLLKLVQAARVAQLLDDPRLEITVFAPTNAGIANALQQYGMNQDMLLGSPSMLAEILYLHIVPNVLHLESLQDTYSFNTLLTDNSGPQSLTVSKANGVTKLSSGADSATVTSADMQQCQAVVYSIDNLLIPDKTMG